MAFSLLDCSHIEAKPCHSMSQAPEANASPDSADQVQLKYYRHPYQSTTFYGAYDGTRLRVTRGDLWGEFDRNGSYLAGPLRYADPCFCRWVTGEHLYNERIKALNPQWHIPTRLVRDRST